MKKSFKERIKDFIQVIKAVNAAMIGVGKKDNLVQDFDKVEKSGPMPYIIVGLLFTIIFIFIVITVVNLVLS